MASLFLSWGMVVARKALKAHTLYVREVERSRLHLVHQSFEIARDNQLMALDLDMKKDSP